MPAQSHASALANALHQFSMPPASDDGQEQWLLVAARVDGLVHQDVAVVNTDVQEAADRVIALVTAVHDDAALYRRIKMIAAAGEFDFGVFGRLLQHAPALWYARHQQLIEEQSPVAVVPEATVTRAVEVRNRMARLLHYHFEDDAAEATLVATLSSTRERLAMANELLTCADLYARRAEVVRTDRRFVDSDEAEARALSSEIRRSLGEQHADEIRWGDRVAVLWTLVQRDYSELRALGQWLLRARPDAARERFPPLVIRTYRGAKASDGAPDGGDAPTDEAKPAAEGTNSPTKPANDAAPTVKETPGEAAVAAPATVRAGKKTTASKGRRSGR